MSKMCACMYAATFYSFLIMALIHVYLSRMLLVYIISLSSSTSCTAAMLKM